MKRSIIGFWLLGILLTGGIFSSWSMNRRHEPIARRLERAAEYALEAQWEQAQALAGSARCEWQQNWNFSAAFADHAPMEEIDSLFAQIGVYTDTKEDVHFASACREISRKIQAMGDAHELTWWNLL